MVRVKLFACKLFIEALEIVHVVVVHQVQHGAEQGADDSHSNVTIVGLWAVILTRVIYPPLESILMDINVQRRILLDAVGY